MNCMGFFSSDTVFTAKEMKYENFKYSKVMKGLLADKDIADILDKKDERKVFYDKMKEVATRTPGGKLTRNGLREVLGYFRSGKAANINAWKEAVPLAQKIAKKLLPAGTRRYLYQKDWSNDEMRQGSPHADISSSRYSMPKTAMGASGGLDSGKSTPRLSRFTPPKSTPRSAPMSPRF